MPFLINRVLSIIIAIAERPITSFDSTIYSNYIAGYVRTHTLDRLFLFNEINIDLFVEVWMKSKYDFGATLTGLSNHIL